MNEIKALVETIQQLQTQVEGLTKAVPPAVRRQNQAARVEERREAVWVNLGSSNGYVHPSGRARVVWDPNKSRWVAYVDGKRLKKYYRKSFNARVAAGIKLSHTSC